MAENNNTVNSNKFQFSAALLSVSFYIFLVIERPWESISFLYEVPIERPFAIAMLFICLLTNNVRIVQSPTNKWIYGTLFLHFIFSFFAFNQNYALEQSFEYFKMVLLYLLMISLIKDEKSFRMIIITFILSTFLYMIHSLVEFHNGRYVYRMGIIRMVGVDSSLSDPNAFGSSVVLSIPFVYALIRSEKYNILKFIYFLHLILSTVCIVLTGSRTATVAFVFLIFLWVFFQKGMTRVVIFTFATTFLCVGWFNMPPDKQERIRTLWDKDAGPANAHESAQGRMKGWEISWEMFKREPLTGVGAGGKNFIGYRMANALDPEGEASPTQSHVLYGQVLAEQGVFGAIFFMGLVLSIIRTVLSCRTVMVTSAQDNSFLWYASGAILFSLLLLLFLGVGGHNFYRPLWLWLAAWSGALLNIFPNNKELLSRRGSNVCS